MISGPQEIVSGKNVSAKLSEIEFAIVLSRVIGSIENDPAQLRNAVYELARIKLQTELSQREAPINVSEKGDLALALESAIDRVEIVYSKHDHLRRLQSLDRLTNSSEVDASEIGADYQAAKPPHYSTAQLFDWSRGGLPEGQALMALDGCRTPGKGGRGRHSRCLAVRGAVSSIRLFRTPSPAAVCVGPQN